MDVILHIFSGVLPVMDLSPGTLLHNRYKIQRMLGKGGMGAVYLATDTSLDIEVAVKCNTGTGEEAARQFLREAHLLASLRHSNLPRVIDYFLLDGNQCLVMDYVPGEDLGQVLEREGPQPLGKVLAWSGQIGSALTYLHNQQPPVIHRDLKPSNLKLTPSGEVMLVDFGIAKAVDTSLQTATGAVGYTPGFAPPEQYGGGRTGPYTDQYGLAATLYMLLTNQRPTDSVQRALGQAVLTPAHLLTPTLPESVSRALEQGMAPQPEARFASVDEFICALQDPPCQTAAMPTLRVQATQAGFSKGTITSSKISPIWLWLAGLVVLFVAALISGLLLSNRIKPGRPATTSAEVALSTETGFSPIIVATRNITLSTETPLPPPTSTLAPTTEPTTTLSPTPAARPIGNGKRLAFLSDRADRKTLQIYTLRVDMDANGQILASDVQQVTTSEGDKLNPAWSPDGSQMLYAAANPEGDQEIYLIDLARPETPPLNLSKLKGADTYPAWSPDGKTIAFTNKSQYTGIQQIFLVDPDGSNRRRLSLDFEEYAPVWAPDMEWLVYVIFARDHRYLFMRNQKEEYKTPQPYDRTDYFGRLGEVEDPDWSPDGAFLAYTRVKGRIRQVFSVEFKSLGANISLLTPASSGSSDPSWSPDAQWIAYTSTDPGNQEIFLMTAAGLLPTNLTSNPARDLQPVWQP